MPHKLKKLRTLEGIKNRNAFESHSVQYIDTHDVKTLEEAIYIFNQISVLINSLGRKRDYNSETEKWSNSHDWYDDFYNYYVSETDLNEIFWFMTESIGDFRYNHEIIGKHKSKELFDKVLKINKKS